MSDLVCQGCGERAPEGEAPPYRCRNAGDGGDHVLARALDAARVRFPGAGEADPNPFVRYRALTHAHALWLMRGESDAAFVEHVRSLDAAVARVWGKGFVVTPFARSAALSERVGLHASGGVWVKDETGNVSGSHKGRHLMGLAILGEVRARLGMASRGGARLAIASCGNAALAAAVVARAWQKPLDVFIPPDANGRVIEKLERLEATIHVCRRADGMTGDPTYHAFLAAVAGGALPFCCQGTDNGLTVEGGETLGWEMITTLVAEGQELDRLFVQVGGGALASACIQAFRDARTLGVPIPLPKIHAVQTEGCFPLRRAWERLAARIGKRLGIDPASGHAKLAEGIAGHAGAPAFEEELAYAASRRGEFMWAWEKEPKSVAHGILDDETYDWLAIARGMLESGGYPVVVGEERLLEANASGREKTGIDADETGTSGLAGLLELRGKGEIGSGERVGVIFSGVRR